MKLNKMNKILQAIKRFCCPAKYEVRRESGIFEYDVYAQIHGVPSGRWVYVERVSQLPDNWTRPDIRVIDVYRHDVDVIVTRRHHGDASQWQFVMPSSDVTIIPIARRKNKENI